MFYIGSLKIRHAVFNWKYKSAIVETHHESVKCNLFSESDFLPLSRNHEVFDIKKDKKLS